MGATRGDDNARGTIRGTIELRGVWKRFGSVAAVAGVDLTVAPGEVHALLGENGAGKTTLLSLLSGLSRPDEGAVAVDGDPVTLASPADAIRLGIGTVHQHQTLVPTLTVRENLLLGDEGGFRLPGRKEEGGRREDGRYLDEFGLDLPMDARVGGLAVGVRQRVEIAKALRRGERALLLDEPTAVLAPGEVEGLLGLVRELAGAGRAVVLVTHKLDEALAASDRITVLRAGRVVLSEAVGEDDREALRGRVVGAMFSSGEEGGGREEEGKGKGERGKGRRGADGVGARFIAPAGGDRRDESRGHGEAGWSEGDQVVGGAGAMNRAPAPSLRRGPLLEVDGVSARDERGAVALDGVSLEVRAGEILGVAGVEGNGQRELAEVLAGQRRPTGGSIRLDGEDVTGLGVAGRLGAGIAMLTDERLGEGIVAGASVALTLALKRLRRAPFAVGVRVDRGAIRDRAAALIDAHEIRPTDPDRDVATLSGGNIQRALVARELDGGPRVLVAVKPTAGLDLRTAERVIGLLRGHAAAGGAVVLTSNELDELLATSDRIAVLFRGRVAGLVERSGTGGPPFDRVAIGRMMLTGRAA